MSALIRTVMKLLPSIAPLVLVAFLGLLLLSCNNYSASEKLAAEGHAPLFTLPEATGGELSLATYQDKQPVLLYFSMAVG